MNDNPVQAAPRRPSKITWLAVAWFFGGLTILVLLIPVGIGLHNGNTLVVIGMFLAAALICFFFVWGLWKLKRWVFWLMICALILVALIGLVVFLTSSVHHWTDLVPFIFAILWLIYLLSDRNVHAAFHSNKKGIK